MQYSFHKPWVALAMDLQDNVNRSSALAEVSGKFTILDREGLQDVACDCYSIVREQYKSMGIF